MEPPGKLCSQKVTSSASADVKALVDRRKDNFLFDGKRRILAFATAGPASGLNEDAAAKDREIFQHTAVTF